MALVVQVVKPTPLAHLSFPLTEGSPITLGREVHCFISLQDTTVSAVHAELTLKGSELFIKDSGSTNGLFIHEKRVDSGVVTPGMHFVVGGVTLRLEEKMETKLTTEERKKLQAEVLRRMNTDRVQFTGMDRVALELKVRVEAEASLVALLGKALPDHIEVLIADLLGLGPLEPLLSDPAVSEIMVNGADKVFVEKKGLIEPVDCPFLSEQQVREVIERIVLPLGRRIDEGSPIVDARLKDGSRVNAVLPPLALDGPLITIRKFSKKKLLPEDLIKFGSATSEMVSFLQGIVAGKKNILISGGTGSGKTTLLNILASFIPEDERVITIEDAAELSLSREHVVRLESRPANLEGKGAVSIRDLVKNALRMRPDRIVVGECRGGEALDMLQAMNTGHDGSMTTGHANSALDMVRRLEIMVLLSGVELPVRAIREQIASAVHFVVQQSRLSDGRRKITAIEQVCGMEGETVSLKPVFRFNEEQDSFIAL